VTFSSYFLGGFPDNGEKTHCYRITKDWKVDEATWLEAKSGEKWNPQSDNYMDQGGAYTEEDAAETGYAPDGEWEEYDVTEIVKYFIDNPDKNIGFLIISDEEYNNTQRLYASSDFTDDTSQRPKLKIVHNTPIAYVPQKVYKDKIALTVTNAAINLFIPYTGHRVTICDAKGQTILSFNEIRNNRYELPLTGFSNGVHFLNIHYEQRSESIAFIVVK
jgi:hypothetical protein